MSNGLERLQKIPPPGECSGMCLVWVEPVGGAHANATSHIDLNLKSLVYVNIWMCMSSPATCLMRWMTSSSVGVVTGLRVSSRWAVRRWVRPLFLRLRVEFFSALDLGDSLWLSIRASSIFANSSSDKTTTTAQCSCGWGLVLLWAKLNFVMGGA